MDIKEKAIKRLNEENKNGKYDRYGNAVKKSVLETLTDFVNQDEEFAQAICEKSGSFEGCIAAVVGLRFLNIGYRGLSSSCGLLLSRCNSPL